MGFWHKITILCAEYIKKIMDFILIILISLPISIILWLVYGILNFIGILNKGEYKGDILESFEKDALVSIFEKLPIIIFFGIVLLGVANTPLFLILEAMKIQQLINDENMLLVTSIYNSIILLIYLIIVFKNNQD